MSKSTEEKMQEELHGLGLPASVFQFTSDRGAAERFLADNPSTPFILRRSSETGYFSLSYLNKDGSFAHALVGPPNEVHSEFLVYVRDVSGQMVPSRPLILYANSLQIQSIERQAALLSPEEKWQQYKQKQELLGVQKSAVLSIQALDDAKVALSPEDVRAKAAENPNLQKAGDGHTGLAMAKALAAPFVVLRSNENQAKANQILQNNIGNNSLLVVTGHGKPGAKEISGRYSVVDAIDNFNNQTQRGYADVAQAAMNGGLKQGDHITVMLTICHGAKETSPGNQDSFAHNLSRELARNGISSTIVASDVRVTRFGLSAMSGDQLTFGEKAGIAAPNVHVFTTEVHGPTANPKTEIYKPNESIQFSAAGMRFVEPPQLKSQASPTVLPESPFLEIPEVDQVLAEESQSSGSPTDALHDDVVDIDELFKKFKASVSDLRKENTQTNPDNASKETSKPRGP